MRIAVLSIFTCVFFFNDTATTEIYTLSLHDALPIYGGGRRQTLAGDRAALGPRARAVGRADRQTRSGGADEDRKSTRLNSSHAHISYAVFCLKKKKKSISTPKVAPTLP